MKTKNVCLMLAALLLAAIPAWTQVHYNDDRDLFIGVSSGAIKPNIMILGDTSGSMNTAIYHPAYNPAYDYFHDASGNDLDWINNIDEDPYQYLWSQQGSGTERIFAMSATRTFKICRGVPHFTYTWDARGTFNSRLNNNPRRWKVYKNTFRTSTGTLYTPLANQIIQYNFSGNTPANSTQIILVQEGSDWGGAYWIITVNRDYAGPPPANRTDPAANSYIYINYHGTVDYTDATEAAFNPSTDTCSGYGSSYDCALYGHTESGNNTRYDIRYLYWLAFYATPQQIEEVRVWATTGTFRDSDGIAYNAGYFRMQVMRDVLKDVASDVYTDVKLGLAQFDPATGDDGASGDGAQILEELNNVANLGNFQLKIDSMRGDTNTPLAEAMADVWKYYKGTTNNYYPNSGQNVPNKIPWDYYCQKSYIILMTDGQSTRDRFIADSKYHDSIFHDNPVKRTGAAGDTGWGDFDDHDPASHTNPDGSTYCPGTTCWISDSGGTDYLDDVAYYLAHSDVFPDEYYGLETANPYMPGQQTIDTFVIGFNVDNDILAETAVNGNGEYYQATSYDSLKTALTNAIVNIQLRNMAFAAFTAPKKITSTVGEGYSFVGYFMPSLTSGIWDGHLQSFRMTDAWYVDLDDDGKLESPNEAGNDEKTNPYTYQMQCQAGNPGKTCLRSVALDPIPVWDTAVKLAGQSTRNIFTHDSATSLNTPIPFTLANAATLRPLFGLPADVAPDTTNLNLAQSIISTLSEKKLGDVFHSDIAYVGPPMAGKKYMKNLNPSECTGSSDPRNENPDCFEYLLEQQANRDKVLYVGTNDGVLHQVNATNDNALGGTERWAFIPDEVLPNLRDVAGSTYTYTVDGRVVADDIYYRGSTNSWRTILVFGLKDGGYSFYCLDVTDANANPQVLWKFQDAQYSGKSWSKPFIGKIRELQPDDTIRDRWVVVLAGGMAFNNEDPTQTRGKAIFVVDASNGELIWSLGYKPTGVANPGVADSASTVHIDTVADSSVTTGLRVLSAKPELNYAIPSAITPVDRDSDGYLDTIYFGNVAGHLFKINIADIDNTKWKAYQLFKKEGLHAAAQATTTISSISGAVITVQSANGFHLHDNVFQPATGAMGTIDAVNNKDLTVNTISPTPFSRNGNAAHDTIIVPSFDPIFLSPAVFFDPCYNLWVAFGTGDRIRSRTNPDTGKFIALRDGTTTVSGNVVQKTDIVLSDLVTLSWTENAAANTWSMANTNIKVANKWGWQFTFPMSDNHEKLFDPEPLVLPDLNMVPHVYFNTYQPSPESTIEDCDAPKNGLMYFYDVKCDYCGTGKASGDVESGRIAGGGAFQGTDYIVYEGTGEVASIPPLQDVKPIKLIYTGGMLFMREKKR